MSQRLFEPAPDAPRLTRPAAIQFFYDGMKPRDQIRVGMETETFCVDDQTLAPAEYSAIEQLLGILATTGGWHPWREGDRIIALERNGALIALEPGGQIEYASLPQTNLMDLMAELARFFEELRQSAAGLPYLFLSMGQHPTARLSDIPLVPKTRYQIMAPRLSEKGPRAHAMMRGTCAWQCAIDYHSESDWRQKFRTAFHITSIVSAIYANSAWEEGVRTGYASTRLDTWMKTDPARCGLIAEAFQDPYSFEDYFEYAAHLPMLFIIREGTWHNVVGLTFRDFLRQGYQGFYATLEDWQLHLGTAFPEARLKQYIELRCADANRFEWVASFPALFLGIFAEPSLMEAACDLTRNLPFAARMALHEAVAKEGLAARRGRVPLCELARELVAIAHDGLERRKLGEAHVLNPIATALAHSGEAPAVFSPASLERGVLAPYLLQPYAAITQY